MKKNIFLSLIFLIITNNIIGQNTSFLNGFKYAVVTPMYYQNDTRDKFGMENKAVAALNEIGILTLNPENTKNWP